MTREELIHHIRYSIDINADIILTNDEGEKVIKALEQEPCEDCISRQAAIKAAMQDVNDRRTHDFNAGATRVANRIKALPSVTPQPKTEQRKGVKTCG